jgi:hypothetical protein
MATTTSIQTLPYDWYVDPAVLRLEQERLFGRFWQYAARVDQLPEPGRFATAMAGETPVVLVRGRDGELRGFVNVCRHRGFVLQHSVDRVRIAPSEQVTPDIRELLSSHKPEVLNALAAEERLSHMPLDTFEKQGAPLEIRVPWIPENLWFVPGERHVVPLTRRGISRGRIWTARELMFLWCLPSLDGKTVEKLGSIKAQLDGEILSVEGPGEGAAVNVKS